MIRSKRQVRTHHIFAESTGEYSFCTLELVKLPTYLTYFDKFSASKLCQNINKS